MNTKTRARSLWIFLFLIAALCACNAAAEPAVGAALASGPAAATATPPSGRPTSAPTNPRAVTDVPPSTARVSPTAAPGPIVPEKGSDVQLLATLGTSDAGQIYNVLWHPNGKALLLQKSDGMTLVNAATWESLWSLPETYGGMIFSADGETLLGLDAGQVVRLDAVNGSLVSRSEISPQGLHGLTPDGRYLADTLGGDISLVDLESTRLVKTLPADINSGAIVDMAFSADGLWAIAGSDDGDLQAWNVQTGQRTLFRAVSIPSQVYSCEVRGMLAGLPTGSLVIACSYPSWDYKQVVYQVGLYTASANASGSSLAMRDSYSKGYTNFSLNSDRSRVIMAAGPDLEVWTAVGSAYQRTLSATAGSRFAVNPADKNLLAAWSGWAVEIWDINRGTKNNEWVGQRPDGAPLFLAFSPRTDERLLAVGRGNGLLQLWDVPARAVSAAWPIEDGGLLSGLAFSPDGAQLAAASSSGSIYIFDLPVGSAGFSPARVLKEPFNVSGIAFSGDGRQLYVVGDSVSVSVWDPFKAVKTAEWNAESEYLISVTARGTALAASSTYGILSIWQPARGQKPAKIRIGQYSGSTLIRFSPDGGQVVYVKGSSLNLLQISNLQIYYSWKLQKRAQAEFSPDGCTLAYADGAALALMDVRRAAVYRTLEDSAAVSSSLAFSPDGLLLAAGFDNGDIKLWGPGAALEARGTILPAVRCKSFSPPPTPTRTPVLTRTLTPTATRIPSITPTATPYPLTRTLSLTEPPMRGDDIYFMQVRLAELGYSEVGTPDGLFGIKTDSAVRRFQELNRLVTDGIVGPITWAALFSPYAVRGQ